MHKNTHFTQVLNKHNYSGFVFFFYKVNEIVNLLKCLYDIILIYLHNKIILSDTIMCFISLLPTYGKIG